MTNNQESLKVINYVNIFLQYKRFILLIALIVTVITGFIMFVVLDPIFYSYGTIKTTTKSGDLTSLIGSSGSIGGMDLGELAGGSASYKELALFENIIMSRRCLEDFIVKYGILDQYGFKYMNDAIKFVRKNLIEITKDKIAGTMEIGVYDKDPQKAKEMVEYIINSLNKINIELNVLNAKNNREFIEKRYDMVKEELKNSEDSLKIFQDIYGIAPDLQIKAATQISVQLEAEKKAEEIKLEILKKMLSDDQPEVKQQKEKIALLSEQVSKIQNTRDDSDLLALKGKPDVAIKFMRLMRNMEIQNKILTFVIPIYEQAKIEEKKETPTLLILDSPFIPDKKVKPARLTMTWISFIVAFSFSFGFFVVWEKWKKFKATGVLNLRSNK
jgi:tyrosine-protein kinase Etk/Wzc